MLRFFCPLLIFTSAAFADLLVTPTVTVTGTEYLYSYKLTNTGPSPFVGFSLTVTVPIDQIASPTGWTSGTIALAPQTLVQWVSTDVPFYLGPGGTLSGFMIESSGSPSSVDFTAFNANFDFVQGQTIGPRASTVPEPQSFHLVSVTLLGIYILWLCDCLRHQRP